MPVNLKRSPVYTAGDRVFCEDGTAYTVLGFLGRGGQGEVYRVRGAEGERALKWYHAEEYLAKINGGAFHENLRRNVEAGVPRLSSGDRASQFVWPQKMVSPARGSFGYIMELFDPRFESMTHVLLGRKKRRDGTEQPIAWKSWFLRVTAALNIVRAFEILHAVGYSYQDINEGGVAIDMQTGEVLICDCDNVSPDGTNLGILGVMRYMAPEVVLRKKLPDRDTDRYSLAVLLFMLFFNSHPMHGTESVALHADESIGQQEADWRIYGSAPHYCLSQANPVNPPHERLHHDVRRLCGLYPRVLLEAFDTVFTEGVQNPQARLSSVQWRKVLLQARDCLVQTDGRESFFYTPQERPLPKEARLLVYPHGRQVLCMPGKILYRCHLEAFGADYATPVGKIVASPKPGVLALYNASGGELQVAYQGKTRVCRHGEYMPLIPGSTITVNHLEIGVR